MSALQSPQGQPGTAMFGARSRARSCSVSGSLVVSGGASHVRGICWTTQTDPLDQNALDRVKAAGDNCHRQTMKQGKKPISDAMRKAIADSGLTYLELERVTGVKRASIMRFMRKERTLRLDMADRLAEHFGIKCERNRK